MGDDLPSGPSELHECTTDLIHEDAEPHVGLSQRCRRAAQGPCTVRRKTVTDLKTTQLFCTSTEPPGIETGVRKVEGRHGTMSVTDVI